MDHAKRLRVSLLALRTGVFIVMFMWALDKIVAPDHAAAAFENFYMLEGMGTGILAAIGGGADTGLPGLSAGAVQGG
ncbi:MULTISPECIES: hypothetical protein [Natronospira]|uniref:hypothetical protein n=1 Tax=Natronospira TaxID=2024969 RepID=UPI0031F8DE66